MDGNARSKAIKRQTVGHGISGIIFSGMNPHGFEVKINGELLCRAGFDSGRHVLACALSLMKKAGHEEQIQIHVGGSEGETIKEIYWIMQRALQRGDQVKIEVVSGNFDPPLSYRDTHQSPSAIDFENDSIKDILDRGRELFYN
jgi:hypothetical protein